MNSQLLKIKQNTILYDDTLISEPDENLFDLEFWANDEKTRLINKGRGKVLLINCQGLPSVLKHYYRGGLVSNFLSEKYLWQGESNARSIKEFRVLQKMLQAGLPVPRPIAARVNRQGIFYTADLITSRIDHSSSMGDSLKENSLSSDLWKNIGSCIASFHMQGFYHHDLNIENILIDSDQKVFLLDFDKAVQMDPINSMAQKNINRLQRSINKSYPNSSKQFPKAEWEVLITEHSKRLNQD
jgi:3-deoxy-D-manno-octulosonic acid kinase